MDGFSSAFRTASDASSKADVEELKLDTLVAHFATYGPRRWSRDATNLQEDPRDEVAFVVLLEGRLSGRLGSKAFDLEAGGLIAIDLGKTSDIHLTQCKIIALVLPRELARGVAGSVDDLHGTVCTSAAVDLLAGHLTALRAKAAYLPDTLQPMLARSLLALLEAALASSRVSSPEPAGSALAAAARTIIDRELGATDLNAARLCRMLGISRSTLHRLFEAQGGFQAYVRNRRLEAVRSHLSASGTESLRDLAERYGFADSAHLSRSFRSLYGTSPTNFRAAIRNNRDSNRP